MEASVSSVWRADGEVGRRAGRQFFHIPLPLHRADPGWLSEIDFTIPGRSRGRKLVFAKVFAVLAIERTNMPDKNECSWAAQVKQLMD